MATWAFLTPEGAKMIAEGFLSLRESASDSWTFSLDARESQGHVIVTMHMGNA